MVPIEGEGCFCVELGLRSRRGFGIGFAARSWAGVELGSTRCRRRLRGAETQKGGAPANRVAGGV